MEIITYKQFKDKSQFMMLMEMAFGWPMNPYDFDKIVQWDERFKNSPVGFCAMVDKKLASHIGVLNIPLKTVEGKIEVVGGIRAVATNPDFANRGMAGWPMEKAHEHFREKGYRFSFLCTSRSFIAYAGYKKLGYVEVESVNRIPATYKLFKKTSHIKKPAKSKPNQAKIFSLFEKYTKDKFGFTIRQKDFVKLYLFRKLISEKTFVQMKNGYVFLSENRGVSRVQEMVASDRATYEKLVIKSEQMSNSAVIDRSVYDPVLLEIYQSRGYKLQQNSNHVLMVKSLDNLDYREVFGDSIYISILDWF